MAKTAYQSAVGVAALLHHHGDQCGVGRRKYVEVPLEIGYLPDDLDAAVGLGLDVDLWMSALKGLRELAERHDQAVGIVQ